MIKGLETFRSAFREYSDSYILIGGAACNINLERAAIPFRTTRDLDIVLCVESLTPEFGRVFWRFIRSGGYQIQERSTGEKKFYRFRKPTAQDYPEMLELFARQPDNFEIPQDSQLTPIPMDEEVSSLSAILLDGEYYQFIQNNRIVVDGISLLSAEALIVLKAKAWLDLSARKEAGEHVDSKDIKKHKNDVFRLWASTSRETSVSILAGIKEDMQRFLALLEDEEVDFQRSAHRHLQNGSIEQSPFDVQNLMNLGSQETKNQGLQGVESLHCHLHHFQSTVITPDINTHKTWNNLATHTPMCVSADYIVVKLRVERKLMYEVLHPRVKAVMARFVAVQEDMRHMVGAEYRRDALFHLGANHVDIIGIEFLVGYDKASSSTCHALRDQS